MRSNFITELVGTTGDIFRFLNTKESKEYLDKLVKVELKLLEENLKGQEADDKLVEKYIEEIKIYNRAARAQMEIMRASK